MKHYPLAILLLVCLMTSCMNGSSSSSSTYPVEYQAYAEVKIECPDCDGVGYHVYVCSTCKGSGRTVGTKTVTKSVPIACKTCYGSGRVICKHCKGTGKMPCGVCDGKGYYACAMCKGRRFIYGEVCPICDGLGTTKCVPCDGERYWKCCDGTSICESCWGSGVERHETRTETYQTRPICPSCDGEPYEKRICQTCEGTGEIVK